MLASRRRGAIRVRPLVYSLGLLALGALPAGLVGCDWLNSVAPPDTFLSVRFNGEAWTSDPGGVTEDDGRATVYTHGQFASPEGTYRQHLAVYLERFTGVGTYPVPFRVFDDSLRYPVAEGIMAQESNDAPGFSAYLAIDTPGSYLRITSYDPESGVAEGEFAAVLVHTTPTEPIPPRLWPDTVRVTPGKSLGMAWPSAAVKA